MSFRAALLALTLVAAFASTHAQQASIDPQLAREIDSIPAIDNHAHPMLSPPADATDREFDALPVDSMAPQTTPSRSARTGRHFTMPGRLSSISTCSHRSHLTPRNNSTPHALA